MTARVLKSVGISRLAKALLSAKFIEGELGPTECFAKFLAGILIRLKWTIANILLRYVAHFACRVACLIG